MPADKLVLDDRIELEEPLDEVPSVLPDAVPEEPIVVGVEPEGDAVPQELEDNAKAGLIMAEISSTYDAIDRINSVIATVMDPDSEKWSDVVSVLNSVADDLTLVVGKLHTALGIADPDAGDAIHQGMQDAGDEVGIDFGTEAVEDFTVADELLAQETSRHLDESEKAYGIIATEIAPETGAKVADYNDNKPIEYGTYGEMKDRCAEYEDSWNVNPQGKKYKFHIRYVGNVL